VGDESGVWERGMSQVEGLSDKVGFIWSVADLLRGDYKAHEFGQVILPLTVLRRLDCVLGPTKDTVVARAKGLVGKIDNIDPILLRAAGQPVYNVSPLNQVAPPAEPGGCESRGTTERGQIDS
jgi:type I restriction enzyme M protein